MTVGTVAVVGAGPTGLALAILMARAGRRVVVHERFQAPAPVGSGFILQPTGLAVLASLGLETSIRERGQALDRIVGRDARSGRAVLDVAYAHRGQALGVHRAALFDLLYRTALDAGVAFETGRTVVDAFDGRLMDDRGVVGPAFDLVVDASGAGSRIAAVRPAFRRSLAWGALWGNVTWPGAPFDPFALQQVYRGASRMIGVLPVGRRLADGPELAILFWSLKWADHPAWRKRGLQAWKDEALSLWPALNPVLSAIEHPGDLTLARYGHHTLYRPADRRLAIIGDAAHATSPQLGQGVNMGLIDALILARSLEDHGDDLDRALGTYCRRRRAHVRLYQALSRGFTPFYQGDGGALPWVRDHLLGRLARLPLADGLLRATVSGRLLAPRL